MHPRFVCSKCGQCDFQAIDDLETHIVEKHYSDVNVLYRCLDPKCPSRFPTESVMLHHMRDKHMGFMSESREGNIVSLRLAIHDTLNDSINISFSTLTNLNGNTFVAPTTSQAAPSPKPNFEHLLSPSGDPNMSVAKSQSFDSPKVDIFKDEPSWVKNLAIASSQGELAAANPDGPSISSYTSQYSFDLEKMGEYSQESVRSTDHNGSTNSGHEQQMPTHSNDGQHIVRQAYKQLNLSTKVVFRCEVEGCNYSSPKQRLFATHMLTHSSTRSHKCRFCHRPFARKAHMLRHELIHFGDKPYKCKFCDYTSTRSDKLKEHLQKVHGVANPKIEQERAPQAPEPINYVEVSEVPISSSGIILNATPVSSTIAFKVEDELSGEML